ncbi:unnamed protein product, partial [Heterotrigona itama]
PPDPPTRNLLIGRYHPRLSFSSFVSSYASSETLKVFFPNAKMEEERKK